MILGIIPARGGSKGIPRKNIKMIAGKPLIGWSIEAARQSKWIDKFVVTTEDKEIAEVAAGFGAEVIPRPPELARDDSPLLGTLQHVLKTVPCDVIVLLHPTSPVRSPGLIDDCINQFIYSNKDVLVTGFDCKYEPFGVCMKPLRQHVDGFFYADGNVYVWKANFIKQGKIYSNNYVKVYTSREENIDIDDPFDFWMAEQVLKERN